MQSSIPFTELSFSGFIINLFQVTLFTLSLLWERTEEELLSWDSLGLCMAGRNTLHEDFFFFSRDFFLLFRVAQENAHLPNTKKAVHDEDRQY